MLLLLVFLVNFPEKTVAQQYEHPSVTPVTPVGRYHQIYLSIPAKLLTAELAEQVSIDFIDKQRAYIYANDEALELLRQMGIEFRIEKSPGEVDFDLNMVDTNEIFNKDLTLSWDFYPTYNAYVALMYHFEETFPDLVKIHNIGTSVDGRLLLFAQIRPNVHVPAAVPQVMLTSTMHGDETAGFVTLLRLIHYLASNYGNNEEITRLLDQLDIWICPNENPDGTYTNDNSTVNLARRFNANGKDLNRNYPGPHPSFRNPPEMPLQPETIAMIDFVGKHNFTLSANIHGGIELVNYPWDAWISSQRVHADHHWWGYVMNEFVDTVHYYSPPTYMRGLGTGITHGGDWYVVYGSRQDYMNYFHGIREFTLEMNDQKLLNPLLLPAHWEHIHRSLINYLEQATFGFHGVVKDAASGDPLQARITLTGYDTYYSGVKTGTGFGNFARPVLSGSYNVNVTADGYDPVVLNNLYIENHQRIDLEINLGPDTYPAYVFANDNNMGRVSGTGVYKKERKVSIRAFPNDGFEFLHWQDLDENILSYGLEYDFAMPGRNVTITGVFAPKVEKFTVVFMAKGNNGQITARVGGQNLESGESVAAGSNIFFETWPDDGYAAGKWIINGSLVDGYSGDEYLLENLTENINLVVEFYPLSFVRSEYRNSLVRVYPNPAWDRFFIEAEFQIRAIELIDDSGRMVSNTRVGRIKNTQISLRGVQSGVYLLRIYGDHGVVVRKVQVQ